MIKLKKLCNTQHRTSLIQMDQGMVRVKFSFVAALVEFF